MIAQNKEELEFMFMKVEDNEDKLVKTVRKRNLFFWK